MEDPGLSPSPGLLLALGITRPGVNNISFCNYPAQNCTALQCGLVSGPIWQREKKHPLMEGLHLILFLSCDFWDRHFLETESWTTKLMVSTCRVYKAPPIAQAQQTKESSRSYQLLCTTASSPCSLLSCHCGRGSARCWFGFQCVLGTFLHRKGQTLFGQL